MALLMQRGWRNGDFMASRTDDLVFATSVLKDGTERIEEMLPEPAVMGWRHPDTGTCNAQVALGHECYIETIAFDPEQSRFDGVRPVGIGRQRTGRLLVRTARDHSLSASRQHDG